MLLIYIVCSIILVTLCRVKDCLGFDFCSADNCLCLIDNRFKIGRVISSLRGFVQDSKIKRHNYSSFL